MKKKILLNFIILIILSFKSIAQLPDFSNIWTLNFVGYPPDGISSWGDISSHQIKGDGHGNLFIVGVFQGTIKLDNNTYHSNGKLDIFIVKLNSAGTLQWCKTYGGTGDDYIKDIEFDKNDNYYISGSFENSINFDGNLLQANSLNDSFFIKYSTNDTIAWVKQFYSINQGGYLIDPKFEIKIDDSDNIYLSYNFYHEVIFLGVLYSSQNNFSGNLFVKLDSNGSLIWSKVIIGATNTKMVFDEHLNIILLGWFTDQLIVDTTELNTNDADIYIAKFNNNGNLIWLKQIGGANQQNGHDIKSDKQGNIYLVGSFSGSIDFGNSILYSTGFNDGYVAQMDSLGTVGWVKQLGGIYGGDYIQKVEIDTSNNLILHCYCKNKCNFDGLNFSSYYWDAGGDILVKLSQTGNIIGYQQLFVYTLASSYLNKQNDLFITGKFFYPAKIGSHQLTGFTTPPQLTQTPIYIAKIGACPTSIQLQKPLDNYKEQFVRHSVKNEIIANNEIYSPLFSSIPSRVVYEAGKSINLLPGFKVENASVFKAEIKGCY